MSRINRMEFVREYRNILETLGTECEIRHDILSVVWTEQAYWLTQRRGVLTVSHVTKLVKTTSRL